jgi:DNA invertase Pin-like site-specific DNA recombinase
MEPRPRAANVSAAAPAGGARRLIRARTANTEQQRELILRAYQGRSSLRGLTRTFGVSRATVLSWLKKKPSRSRP